MCSWNVMKGAGLACLLFFVSVNGSAQQKKWDGGAGDSLYTTAANWVDDMVPLPTDSVLLDNSMVSTSYIVLLPPGNISVNCAFLKIQPSLTAVISFVIPKLNSAIPALNSSGGIVLEERAVLHNSSGASSGNAITIADSLYVFNGASYIHNTDIGHASLITRLASRPGTENGTVEFNVPGTASYTLSVSNRIYGNLILNAVASGGTRTYISTGINPLMIKGNCMINTGATYSLNFSGDITVLKNLQVNGVLNLSTGSNSNIIKVKGDCKVDGSITESGSGSPIIIFDGTVTQAISVRGQINNSVTIRTNNPSGILLSSPVIINHKLEMLAGRIHTTDTTLLTIAPSGSIVADSTQSAVFVNGPLRKQGLIAGTYFLFPVGSGAIQRWLRIQEAVGDFTVTFYKIAASSISPQMDTSLHHVSNLEYWKVQAMANQSAKIELSFNDVNSGGVTNLTSLRVAQLQDMQWKSAGATAFTGAAGAAGSVLSDTIRFQQTGDYFFSLGSSLANQNPLPIRTVALYLEEKQDVLRFRWVIQPLQEGKLVELQGSTDGISFKTISTFESTPGSYDLKKPISAGFNYFRMQIHWKDGARSCSAIQVFSRKHEPFQLRYLYPVIGQDFLQLTVVSDRPDNIELRVLDVQGNLIHKYLYFISIGELKITLPIGHLRAGQYQIFGLSSGLYTKPLRFIKS